MLSNAYFLAKFRFDTAENEPAENLQNFANNIFPILLTLTPDLRLSRRARRAVAPRAGGARVRRGRRPRRRTLWV